jgi:uncharacterized protein YqeY
MRSMMNLQEKLLNDMKSALKSGDKETLGTIRMLRSQLQNASIKKGKELSDEDVIGVLSKEAKKRKESVEMYKKGEREDLVEKEAHELEIISSYLPEALSREELESIVEKAIEEARAESLREMGKVMGFIMPQVKGRADGKEVQEIVKNKLS